MRVIPRAGLLAAVTAAVAICFVFTATAPVEARPQYKKAFEAVYPDKLEKVDCKICHPQESKKIRNAYGKAVGAALGKANEKDAKKIEKALEKAGKAKSKGGETYGELIEAGKSPAAE